MYVYFVKSPAQYERISERDKRGVPIFWLNDHISPDDSQRIYLTVAPIQLQEQNFYSWVDVSQCILEERDDLIGSFGNIRIDDIKELANSVN